MKNYFFNSVLTHTDEKPYKCNICEKAYKQSMSLKEHMWTHTEWTPPQNNEKLKEKSEAEISGIKTELIEGGFEDEEDINEDEVVEINVGEESAKMELDTDENFFISNE